MPNYLALYLRKFFVLQVLQSLVFCNYEKSHKKYRKNAGTTILFTGNSNGL